MTSPAKYTARLRAQKSGPDALSPKTSIEAAEQETPSYEEIQLNHTIKTHETCPMPRVGEQLIGFMVSDADEQGYLFCRDAFEEHGILMQEWYSDEDGFYASLDGDGRQSYRLRPRELRDLAALLSQHADLLESRSQKAGQR